MTRSHQDDKKKIERMITARGDAKAIKMVKAIKMMKNYEDHKKSDRGNKKPSRR